MNFIRKLLAASLCIALAVAAVGAGYWFVATAGTSLDEQKFELSDCRFAVYDNEDTYVAEVSMKGATKSVRIGDVPEHVKNAFLAAEDKNFYSHHGLDYKGMLRALVKNVKARAFRQGASTISQQLIKNTQLSGEKTLRRKLKEIKLTRQLEKKYSKDKILEMYLNTIYFGHSCYGIAGASDFYFSKDVSDLTPAEGAMLAAILKSPNNYSPFVDEIRCKNARDTVIQRMFLLGFLSEAEAEQAKNTPLPTHGENAIAAQSYLSGVKSELEALPLFSPYLKESGWKVYTYMNTELQQYAETLNTDADRSGKSIFICENESGGISARYSTVGEPYRQPGSVIKPLAVYAPAIEAGLISPCTKITDEKTVFDGYSPSNYKDVYKGEVSVRQALAESLNVPAVKILQMLGTKKSAETLRALHLPLDERDDNLALALGGLTHGFTIRELSAAYATFARGGIYRPCAFIKRIEDEDGNILYRRDTQERRVFSEDTSELVLDMLRTAVKEGTAKKLNALPFDICAKTGTSGDENGNTDAWTIASTSEHTFAVWMGNADNKRTDITGGGLPCHYTMLLAKKMYAFHTPADLQTEMHTQRCRLDRLSYEKDGSVLLASAHQPARFTFEELFRQDFAPRECSSLFEMPKAEASISCENNAVILHLCQTEYYDYLIKRQNNGKERTIFEGHTLGTFEDRSVRAGEKYSYSVTPYFISDSGEKILGETTILPSVFLRRRIPSNWWMD